MEEIERCYDVQVNRLIRVRQSAVIRVKVKMPDTLAADDQRAIRLVDATAGLYLPELITWTDDWDANGRIEDHFELQPTTITQDEL